MDTKKRIVVTGGSGFIGSCLVKMLVSQPNIEVLNIDNLTYAASEQALMSVQNKPNYQFCKIDVASFQQVLDQMDNFEPDAVFHLAAESHVDRSIDSSNPFIHSNILGTHALLEASLNYFKKKGRRSFRFVHVSTDEVYGSLSKEDPASKENSPYNPSSPYSASKASSDMLVNAWNITYGLPTVTTHCTNNFGEFQNDEKFIPTLIRNALQNREIPIYGTGSNVRDWLYVEDHCAALICTLDKATPGEVYNIKGGCSKTNLDLAHQVCSILDQIAPKKDSSSYKSQITFIKDRLGHDYRYDLDDQKIREELGWQPNYSFEKAILKTIKWYVSIYYEGNYFSRGQRDSVVSAH